MTPLFADPGFARRWALRLGAAFLLVFYLRVAWVSRDEFALAETAMRASDVATAVAHYRRAARHVAPPFDSADESIAALFAIARRAEASSDVALALSAFRSIRAAGYAARIVGPRHGDDVDRANHAIARLLGTLDRSPDFRDFRTADVVGLHEHALERGGNESVAGLLLVLVSFVSILVSGRRLVTNDITLDDRVDLVRARRSLLALGIGLVGFVIGLFVT